MKVGDIIVSKSKPCNSFKIVEMTEDKVVMLILTHRNPDRWAIGSTTSVNIEDLKHARLMTKLDKVLK